MLRIAAVLTVLAGALAMRPADAQLGAIFGDSPPRPPADVPERAFPPQPPPVQYPGPAPLPSPSPGSSIQTQPLPPPPGASLAPTRAPSQATAPQSPPAAQQPRIGFPPPAVQPTNPPPQPADTSLQPDDTVVTEMPAQKIENSRAVFSGLDKITGRIISFDAAIGETVQFGALQVTARVCYTRPPTEATNTDAFVQVDEVTLQGDVKRIFSGWMFAASPGLHAVEHPIYDVWLTDCASPIKVAEPAAPPAPAAAANTRTTPPSARTRQPRQQSAAPPISPAPAPVAPASSH